MRKSFILFLSLINLLIVSCQKSNEDLLIEKSPIKNEKAVMALSATPTSVSNGMKNYESYFLSKVDGKIHGYIISTPLDYDPSDSKKYPLLVFMHGLGEKPNYIDYDFAKLKQHGPHKEIFYKGRAFPAIVASFQLSKYEGEFNPHVVKEFIDVLTGVSQVSNATQGEVGYGKYNIDLQRLHLTGLSLGGNGVYKTAFSYPNMFASLSVFAGYTGSSYDMSKIKRPTYIRHNQADNVVGVSNAYNAQTWINNANPVETVNFKIFSYPGHDSWGTEYSRTDEGNVYNWHWSKYLNTTTLNSPLVSTPSLVIGSSLLLTEMSPANNQNVSSNRYSRITFKFNNNVTKGTGTIEIKNLTDNTVYKVNSDWGMVGVNGNTVSIYPVNLEDNKKYAVRITKGAFKDSSGNPFEGINDDNTWTFTAGNYSSLNTSNVNTSNTASEVFQPTSLYPSNNAIISRPSNGYINLVLNFNKNVIKGSGTIKIQNLTDNTSASVNANWGMVSANGTKATLYPISVQAGKKYAVIIANNSFKDESGTFYNGISNTYTWVFEVK